MPRWPTLPPYWPILTQSWSALRHLGAILTHLGAIWLTSSSPSSPFSLPPPRSLYPLLRTWSREEPDLPSPLYSGGGNQVPPKTLIRTRFHLPPVASCWFLWRAAVDFSIHSWPTASCVLKIPPDAPFHFRSCGFPLLPIAVARHFAKKTHVRCLRTSDLF